MAEFLSPGVFVEEVPSTVQTIQSVSTSNLGIIGNFPKGPTDVATLITSPDQLNKVFGGLTKNSFAPLNLLAFFANGGRRAYVVRVMPSDAVLATADLQTKRYDQQIEDGDGVVVAFTKTLLTTQLEVAAGASPLVEWNATGNAGTQVRWRGADTPIAADALRDRTDAADIVLADSVDSYDFRITAASIPALAEEDYAQFAVVPDGTSAIVNWDPDGGGNRTAIIAAPVSGTVGTLTNGNGSVFVFDFATGRGSVKFALTDIPDAMVVAASFTMDFTPATVSRSIRDNGAGAWVDMVAGSLAASPSGAIDSTDGSYSFTTGATVFIPHDGAPILATYATANFSLSPISKGVWANDVRVSVQGSPDYFNVVTQSYTRYDVSVLQLNTESGTFVVQESYEALVADDPDSAQYLPDVLNELSDLVAVATPGGDKLFRTLEGLASVVVLGGGDELAGGQDFGNAGAGAVILSAYLKGLGYEIGPRSLNITYTDATLGTTKTITDDGSGTLAGDVDPSYATIITVSGTDIAPNTVDYVLGVANFKTGTTIKGGTVVQASFYTDASESAHVDQFGDTAKQYTDSLAVAHYVAGTEGTFTSGTYSRSQFTSPTLQASYKGMFALSKVDEIMQVAIPDFAGDVTVSGDQLDYAASRASLPSGGDRFIILAVPVGSDAQEAVDWFRYDLGRYSKYAALYWPWIKVADPLANGRPLLIPPLGHVAGVYARTDTTKNVGKAPGGTVDGALTFLLGLERELTQGDKDTVYPNKINPLSSGPQTGLCVWGVRTIAIESEWRYINARRLFMFLEKSIYNATAWIVFENNGPQLWARIKGQLDGYMNNLYTEGLFFGTNPSQAFFVVVGTANNDAATIEAGQVIIDVGAAPNRPAEFVRFRFQQMTLNV